MADTDEIKEQEEQEDSKQEQQQEQQEDSKVEKSDEKASGGGILPWIIMFAVLIFCGGAGFVLGRLFGGSRTAEITEYFKKEKPPQVEHIEVNEADGSAANSQKDWFYDLEPVVANLNEAGVTRYVRAALTLEINSEVDKKKGLDFLDEKKPILTNWLTIYLASLGLEDIRGDGNLKRIQSQILDGFNEKLFPDSKPQIRRILFKEFAVQ